jgi:hypothetical protein
MKVSKPFGIPGSLSLNASYAVGKTTRALFHKFVGR